MITLIIYLTIGLICGLIFLGLLYLNRNSVEFQEMTNYSSQETLNKEICLYTIVIIFLWPLVIGIMILDSLFGKL